MLASSLCFKVLLSRFYRLKWHNVTTGVQYTICAFIICNIKLYESREHLGEQKEIYLSWNPIIRGVQFNIHVLQVVHAVLKHSCFSNGLRFPKLYLKQSRELRNLFLPYYGSPLSCRGCRRHDPWCGERVEKVYQSQRRQRCEAKRKRLVYHALGCSFRTIQTSWRTYGFTERSVHRYLC